MLRVRLNCRVLVRVRQPDSMDDPVHFHHAAVNSRRCEGRQDLLRHTVLSTISTHSRPHCKLERKGGVAHEP